MVNFFAALDDSGDEGSSPPVKKETKPKKPPVKQQVVEPSKPDARRKPNNHDRNTKHGRGGRAPARDGKRAYERRSGTGRGKEIKKDGGGARNWGSDKNDARDAAGILDEQQKDAAEAETTPAVEGEENKEETNEGGEEEQAPPEEEDKTMSYEEYLATKQAPENEAFKPVAEREVDNEFSGITAKVAKKQSTDDVFFSGGKEKAKRTKQKKAEAEKLIPSFRVTSDVDRETGRGGRGGGRGRGRGREGRGEGRGGGRGGGRFEDGGRGGRGGRGRGRGRGGGRGGGRDYNNNNKVNPLDESAFPSLA